MEKELLRRGNVGVQNIVYWMKTMGEGVWGYKTYLRWGVKPIGRGNVGNILEWENYRKGLINYKAY